MKTEICRELFAMTGNQCAFPGCKQSLLDADSVYLGHVCHIEAAKKLGPRYNPEMTDEARHSVKNLIVLCPTHHTIVDKKENLYTVDCLQKMKAEHENTYAAHDFELSDYAIRQILEEQLQLQYDVNQKNVEWRESFDLAMELELSDDPSVHLNEISKFISQMELWMSDISKFLYDLPNEIDKFFNELGYDLAKYRAVPNYRNPFQNSFWEITNIGVPNINNFIQFHSNALEVHIYLQQLKANPNDTSLRKKVDNSKAELLKLASTLVHVD